MRTAQDSSEPLSEEERAAIQWLMEFYCGEWGSGAGIRESEAAAVVRGIKAALAGETAGL